MITTFRMHDRNEAYSRVVEPGHNAARRIEAVARLVAERDIDGEVVLLAGDYFFERPCELVAGTIIRGVRGLTWCTAEFTGGADDPTNAIFRASETVGTIATTIATAAHAGAKAITLASVAGLSTLLAAGRVFLRLSGNNNVLGDGGPLNPSAGATVTTYEIVEVDSLPGGNVVNLKTPLKWYQAVGKTVVDVTPVEGAGVIDLVLDGGVGPVACGVLLRGALDCEVHVQGKNFSRAVVSGDRGSADCVLDVEMLGACNAGVILRSCHGFVTEKVSNVPGGDPYHASGYRRAAYFERDCCVANELRRLSINGLGLYGLLLWGSNFGRWSDITIRNCDATDAHASMIAAGEQGASGRFAYVWTGAGDVSYAEFGFGGHIGPVLCENNTQVETYGSQVWLHDYFQSTAEDIRCIETRTPSHLGYCGLRVHDCQFEVVGILSLGYQVGMLVENDPSACLLRDVTLTPASAANGGLVALYLDTITARGMEINGLRLGSADTVAMFYWGASFTNTAAQQWCIRDVSTDAMGGSSILRALEVFFTYQPDNHVLSFGQLAELQAASADGERLVRPPNAAPGTNPSTRVCGVLQGRNFGGAGWCACMDLRGGFTYVTGTYKPGDCLRPANPNGADNQGCVVDNAPADFNVQRSIFGRVQDVAYANYYAQIGAGL